MSNESGISEIPSEVMTQMIMNCPGVYVNGLAVAMTGQNVRLIFTEQYGPNNVVRMSLTVPLEFMIQMRDMLIQECKKVEIATRKQ